MKKWLKADYFRKSTGEANIVVDSLSDCIVQSLYLIGKNQYNFQNFNELFLNETTLRVVFKGDELVSLGTVENVYEKGFFDVILLSDNKSTASSIISNELKDEKMVIVNPIIERFPFSEFYDPAYKESRRRSEHVFLIIGEDNENYYFVDNPDIVIKERFVPYKINPQVGVLNKDLFSTITDDICDVLSPVFYPDIIAQFNNKWVDVFHSSYVNYEKKYEEDKNETVFYGRQALAKLSEYFKSDNMQFDKEAPTHDRNLITYFRWRIWNIKGRRSLQSFFLKEHEDILNKDALIMALDNSWKHWDVLNMCMYKDFLTGKKVTGNKYISLIESLTAAEDSLHNEYGKFVLEYTH